MKNNPVYVGGKSIFSRGTAEGKLNNKNTSYYFKAINAPKYSQIDVSIDSSKSKNNKRIQMNDTCNVIRIHNEVELPDTITEVEMKDVPLACKKAFELLSYYWDSR